MVLQEEVGVGVVQVETFVGDEQRVRLVCRALHLLLRVAPRVRATVVAPALLHCMHANNNTQYII